MGNLCSSILSTEDVEDSQSLQHTGRATILRRVPVHTLPLAHRSPAARQTRILRHVPVHSLPLAHRSLAVSQTRPLRAPSSLFAVVPGDGFGDELLPGQGRLRLTVRAGGEKSRHGDGAEELRRSRQEPKENRALGFGDNRGYHLPTWTPVPGCTLSFLPSTEHEAQETQPS